MTSPVRGSTRETVSSSVLSIHTPPSPTAMLLGGVTARVNEAMSSPLDAILASPLPSGGAGAAGGESPPRVSAIAATAARASTPAATTAQRRRTRRTGTRTPASASRAASISSAQLPYRSPGSLASAFRSTGSSSGRPGTGGTGSCMCAHSVSASVAR